MPTDRAVGLTWGPGRLPVPYVTPWSAEERHNGTLTFRPDGSGLCYRDETPGDRDTHGVLWARTHSAPGQGTPNFASLHQERQRHTMLNLLCQVCGGPADRNSKGWLFLRQRDKPERETTELEGALCSKPPLCRPCAELAVLQCPRLTDPVAIRVRKPRTWGVLGDQFGPSPTGGLTILPTDGHMPYGHPARPWFLATQLVLELNRCTRVPLPT